MPHGKLLTDFEKGQISAFAADGVHVAEIANRLGRSRKVVYNFLENPQNYGKNHKGGRQRKLTTRDERHVQRLASNSRNSAAAIGREVQSDASRWTIRRAILRADHLVHSKLQHKPRLTDMRVVSGPRTVCGTELIGKRLSSATRNDSAWMVPTATATTGMIYARNR